MGKQHGIMGIVVCIVKQASLLMKNLPNVTRAEAYTAVAMFKSFVHVMSRRI